MANKSKFQAIKGTRDLLPPETALWNQVEQTAREVFSSFNFGEIRSPIFEPTELFARAVGGDTDIVGKEMYTFGENPNLGSLEESRDIAIEMHQSFVDKGQGEFFVEAVTNLLRQIGSRVATGDLVLGAQTQSDFDQLKEFLNRTSKVDWTQQKSELTLQDRSLITQILLKVELLRFTDRVSLRPEATASVCRAYIEHSMQQLPQPVKLYYIGPMFRRERPQKGRYRQFYQIGAEVLGGQDAPAIDAEVIEMLMTFFDKLNLKGLELDINSIGHNAPNCRPAYVALLKQELEKVKDKLGADSQRRIETNPLRVLDSKLDFEQPIIATLPKIADHLCDECKKHYEAVKTQLRLRGVFYKENWRLVRGLDYYMRTTFEITAKGLGSQNAVCGGGRYDGLVELLGGPPTKGIGFAIGEDRLILSLQEQAREAAAAQAAAQASGAAASETQSPVTSHQSPLTAKQPPLIFIAWMGQNTYATAVRAAKDLRNAGFPVEVPPTELKFGKALGQADKLGAQFALILGENEVSENMWTLKNLTDGSQIKLPEPDLIAHLRSL
jgi:histidyl-tRNA synthetase